MYRIEVKPGEENVFRTIEELATAIRNGLVTSRARIYHNASQKWLPIEFHPHYKKALQMPKTKSGETPAIVMASPMTKAPEPAKAQEPVKQRVPAPVHTPTPVPAPVVAKVPVPKAPVEVPPPVAPPVVAASESVSPVIELPPIDYPETDPIESLIPVASASKARASTGRRRPLLLGSAAAVLIAGTYVAISGAMPAHQAAADNGPITKIAQPAPEPVHQLAVAPPAKPDSSVPSPVVTAAATPTSSGPTFGPRGAPPAPKREIVTSIGATAPAPAPKDSVETIEPAPADVDLSVPSVPSGDSLAPVGRTDSNAIGRILRAVGSKGGSTPRP